jgi:hypothetical protein
MVRSLVGLAVVVALGASAHAAPPSAAFLDVAATADGGAWLLVRTENATDIWRVSPDGGAAAISAPEKIEAIAVAPDDDTLWALRADRVLHRDAKSAWASIPLGDAAVPPESRGQTLTPLGHDRVLVLRRCASGNDCAEAYVVDASHESAIATFDWRVGPAVADGRGGAWAMISHGVSVNETVGFAHLGETGWEAWRFNGNPVAGMTDRGNTPVAPKAIAPGRDGGFVGIMDQALVEVGADGQRRLSVPIGLHESFANQPLGLARVGDHYAIAFGTSYGTSDDDAHDPAPVVATVALAAGAPTHTERAALPSWWRRTYARGTPPVRISGAGGTLWIMASDLVAFHAHDWQTVVASPAAAADAPSRVAVLLSLPADLGVGHTDGSTGLAIGVRPEVIFTPNVAHPRYGLGVFGELAHEPNLTPYGGGVTLVGYLGPLFGVAASVGVDRVHGDPQLVYSGFVGIRTRLQDLPFDIPLGLRIDVRPATAQVPGSVMVSASIDVVASALIAALLSVGVVTH